jgi:hypothetical protein
MVPKKFEHRVSLVLPYCHVVYRAPQGCDDREWYNQAREAGAKIFVSADLDIANLAMNDGLEWVDMPQRFAGNKLVNHLIKQVSKIKRPPCP